MRSPILFWWLPSLSMATTDPKSGMRFALERSTNSARAMLARETNALRIAPRVRFWFVFYALLADFQGGRDVVA